MGINSKDVQKRTKQLKKYKRLFNKHKKQITVGLSAILSLFIIENATINNTTTFSTTTGFTSIQQANVESVDVWCELVRVVDGDTIIVKNNGEDTRVRFIGVDTPESVHVDSSKNTDEGIVASDYTKALLQDVKVVGLEFDEGQYDIYNRLLAYVYLEDGMMLNAHLVETGYAEVKTYQPNTKYESYFKSLVK